MIRVPYFLKFRTAEAIQYAVNVLNLCKSLLAVDRSLQMPCEELRIALERFEAAAKTESGSELSDEVRHLDQLRDRALIGIHSTVEGLSYHIDGSVSQSAALLLNSIDKHGSQIAKLNLQSETYVLDTILDEWATDDKLASALKLLNLASWADHLRDTNKQFNDTYENRAVDMAQNPQVATTEPRNETLAALRRLFKHVEAHVVLGSSAGCNALVADINALTDRYNQTVTHRQAFAKDNAPVAK